ncbi:MAG TPA: signal peptidase I [Candidatus Limnocylindria bacterium]|nr:signal peptidase I [Candidatus Limnocylindria bacterium]
MNRSLGTAARVVERVLSALWLVALVAVVGLAVWSHLATLVIVAGGSMEPAIPRGSLIQPVAVDAEDIGVGDVVTVRADNGALVTHRVVRAAKLPAGLHLELQGDANETPDPVLVAASRVVGRVDYVVPGAGYLLSMLTTWTGVLAVVALFAAALIGLSLLEDFAADASGAAVVGAGQARGRAHASR